MNIDINWLAILASVAVSMGIGFVWYGPMFAKQWMKEVGKTEKDLAANQGMTMGTAIFLAAIQAFALKHFIVFVDRFYPSYSPLAAGLLTAWWLWLGVVFTSMTVAYMFASKSRTLIFIDTGYQLVVLLLNAAILSLWT
jgi:hypothetical protein